MNPTQNQLFKFHFPLNFECLFHKCSYLQLFFHPNCRIRLFIAFKILYSTSFNQPCTTQKPLNPQQKPLTSKIFFGAQSARSELGNLHESPAERVIPKFAGNGKYVARMREAAIHRGVGVRESAYRSAPCATRSCGK